MRNLVKALVVVLALVIIVGECSGATNKIQQPPSVTLTYAEQQAIVALFSQDDASIKEAKNEAHYWHQMYDELRQCVATQRVSENAFTKCLGGI